MPIEQNIGEYAVVYWTAGRPVEFGSLFDGQETENSFIEIKNDVNSASKIIDKATAVVV